MSCVFYAMLDRGAEERLETLWRRIERALRGKFVNRALAEDDGEIVMISVKLREFVHL